MIKMNLYIFKIIFLPEASYHDMRHIAASNCDKFKNLIFIYFELNEMKEFLCYRPQP